MTNLSYQETIIQRLRDKRAWPDFERRQFLSELNGIAEDAFFHETLEGYLGALLIYSQLAEDIIRLLIEDAEFFVQLNIFPTEIHFLVSEKATLGNLINALEHSIEFDNKQEIIALCQELNEVRKRLVHQLTKHSDSDSIEPEAELARSLFEAIFATNSPILGWFRDSYEKILKNKNCGKKLIKSLENITINNLPHLSLNHPTANPRVPLRTRSSLSSFLRGTAPPNNTEGLR